MKCIEKAMTETEFKPRKKWWGFVSEKGHRYLCRYAHLFVVFSDTEVLYSNYETITDKRGVDYAIKLFNKQIKQKDGQNKSN